MLRFAGCVLTCVSGDAKPTGGYLAGWRALETDTGKLFISATGAAWTQIQGKDLAETLTGKTISGSDNTITNIGKSSLPGEIVYHDQANAYDDTFAQDFHSSYLRIYNPAGSKLYTIVAGAIANDYTATLPTLIANDKFTFDETATTLKSKTIDVADNTLTSTAAVAGDLLKHNGTKFVRMGLGSSLQVLRTNVGETDLEWADETGGTGEANTYSNSGLSGVAIILTKNVVDLPFKAIDAGSSKITVTNDAVNYTVDIDADESEFTLSNIGGSITKLQSATNTVFTDQANTFGDYLNAFGGAVEHDKYTDIKTITIPADPAATFVRVYAKAIDATNYGLYSKVLQDNVNNEIRIF